MTKSFLIGVPTGWHLNSLWQANFMQWIGGKRTDGIAMHFEPSNTKACSYSRLIDLAKDGDYDGLLIWETNVIWEVPLDFVLKRVQHFDCVFTPGRFVDDSIGADAIFHPDAKSLPSEDVGNGERELSPFECRWGCTHAVYLSQLALNKLEMRFMWTEKDARVDHDMPIYCFDGDTWPDHPDPLVRKYRETGNEVRRLSIEQSLYSNLRAHGIGVWADPQLKTINLRLGGAYRSLRLEDMPRATT